MLAKPLPRCIWPSPGSGPGSQSTPSRAFTTRIVAFASLSATASLRGRAKFGGFAAAKAGLRTHAQAMAREFGSKGVHVAHVVVDGVVDGDRAQQFGYGLGKAYLLTRGDDGSLKPDAVAEAYWQLHLQHRSCWTHELDLRPYKETF